MITFEGLEENFTFLVAEVERQVRAAASFLDRPSHALYDRIVGRDDYIDNLHTVVENKSYGLFYGAEGRQVDKAAANRVRSIQVITDNLERIADFCENIVQQTNYLTDHEFLRSYAYQEMFDEIEACLARILPALGSGSLAEALALCRAELTLDRLYKAGFDRIMGELRTGKNVQNLITVLFIFRYLERIGDALLNIGEALIFSILGERIKIEQFEALQQTLSKTGFTGTMEGVDFKAIWGTRSGCRIGRVGAGGSEANKGDSMGSIYKEGTIRKIQAEKEALERWGRLYPGLVAEVFGYHEDGDKASMLVEFLPGCGLDEVILTSSEDILQNALFVLTHTAQDIWEDTLQEGPCPAGYMRQLAARLEEVRQIHPGFTRGGKGMGKLSVSSTRDLLAACAQIEEALPAPFSVLIHGDFNVNNIVYNHQKQRLHYLDVHRSRQLDYVQDASVFLVSNYRMPVFEPHLRERIDWVVAEFLQSVARFAERRGDATFEVRMALALGRSLATSSRFELNHAFSREMILRAHYLLERVAAHQGRPWQDFRLPQNILFH